MSRFSPTVRPSSRPGGLGGLAAALQEGVGAYRDTQDRAEQQRDRERQRVIQTDTLASQGMTPQFADAPESFGSALSRAMAGQPTPAPRRAVAPGAFKPWDGDFEKPDPMTGRPQEQALPTMRLPSGGTYDPNVPLQREGASLMQKGRIGNQMESEGRKARQDELTSALQSVPNAPLGAAASEGASASWLGRPPERGLRLGDPGYAEAMAEVAGARYAAAGGGQNRPPTEVESKDYIFAGLMENSMNNIRRYAPYVRPEVVTMMRVDPVGLSKAALTDEEQLFISSVREFTAAALRKESGAAITPSEVSDAFDRYIDTGFDRPKVREAKAQSRENYLRLLRNTSARARNYYDGLSGNAPAAATPAAPRKQDFMPPED